ncbi:MAG: zinc ribbon domain-containing protein [Clostridia bacterium]|nr:zinc ribbon domain-containing protein [Clostridia bacterium]
MKILLLLLLIFLAAPVAIAGIVILTVFAKIRNDVRNSGLSGGDIGKAVQEAKQAADDPEPRTVFGATKMYLDLIRKDFPDYHNDEAVSALKTLIREFLEIRFEGREKYDLANVEEGLELMADRGSGTDVTEIKIHSSAISAYDKTKEYATVTYVAAAGFRAGDRRYEERYRVKYTLKLIENNYPAKMLVCPRCGGAVESTRDKVCPFCGSGIIRDTILSWRFTSIELD